MIEEPIDIVLPWVNPTDINWLNDFAYWKEKETGDKCEGRFRDCNTLKYVFRSIEDNCPWCRYVFLVLSSPTQIPSWLNINSPKLKIVYHKDYIPEEFLPTFNTSVIELFYCFIKELSENFILINDDMFFTKNPGKNFYFQENLPVYKKCIIKPNLTDNWFATLNRTLNVAKQITHKDIEMYHPNHLPISYKKSIWQFVHYKNKDLIYSTLKPSRFRNENRITSYLFYYITNAMKQCIYDNTERGRFYFFTNKNTKYDFNCNAVCLNESGEVSDENIDFLTKQLNIVFSKKSSFEF